MRHLGTAATNSKPRTSRTRRQLVPYLFPQLHHVISKPSNFLRLRPRRASNKEESEVVVNPHENQHKRKEKERNDHQVPVEITLATVVSMRSCLTNCETIVLRGGTGNRVLVRETKRKKGIGEGELENDLSMETRWAAGRPSFLNLVMVAETVGGGDEAEGFAQGSRPRGFNSSKRTGSMWRGSVRSQTKAELGRSNPRQNQPGWDRVIVTPVHVEPVNEPARSLFLNS